MNRSRPTFLASAAILAAMVLAAFGAHAQGVLVEPDYPLQGAPSTIRVFGDEGPAGDVTVEVTYRPNSEASFSETLGPTDADGTLAWQPSAFGLVVLRATLPQGTVETRVAVREGRFPTSGILTMVGAAILLFGGVIAGLVLLLRD